MSKSLADCRTTQAQSKPLRTEVKEKLAKTSVDTHCRGKGFHIWGPGKLTDYQNKQIKTANSQNKIELGVTIMYYVVSSF